MNKRNVPTPPTPPQPVDNRLLEMIDRLNTEMGQVKGELRGTQDELRATQGELRDVQTYAARLAMQVIRLGGEPIRMTDVENSSSGSAHTLSWDAKRMLSVLRESFSAEELDVVAFEIGLKSGELGEGSPDTRAVKLIEAAKGRGRLIDLAGIIVRERPDAARR